MAAPTLDSTVGGSSANSFITTAAAQAYFDERLSATEWDTSSGADQDRALIMATVRLSQEDFAGYKTDSGQALVWPRQGTYDEDGYVYANNAIPEPIANAQCEMALALLKDPSILADSGLEGFVEVGVGSGAVKAIPRGSRIAGELPAMVRRELARGDVWAGTSGISGIVTRG